VAGDQTKTRLAETDDYRVIAAALARAFYHDPFMAFALPEATTRLAISEEMFHAQLETVFVDTAEVHTTPDLTGAAIWTPPDPPELTIHASQHIGERMRDLFGERVPVIGAALTEIRRHRPAGEHWYLDFLGTDPDHQGRGTGTAVLAPVLDRCDAAGTDAILWTTTEANVHFYAGRGFEVTADVQPPAAPRVWWMRRHPR